MKKVKLKPGPRIINIPCELLISNPLRARVYYDDNDLCALAASIKEFGIIEPLTVTPNSGDTYTLISGERRLRAAKSIGIEAVPCVILTPEATRNACFCLLGNFMSRRLNIFEQASAIEKLHDRYDIDYAQIAVMLGTDEGSILNIVRHLSIPLYMRKIIIENGLTDKHIKILLRLTDDKDREMLLSSIIKHKLNVSKTEELYKRIASKNENNREPVKYFGSITVFVNTFDHAIETLNSSGIKAHCTKNEAGNQIEYSIILPKTGG